MTIGLQPGVLDTAVNYQTPTTGFSITLGNEDWHVILDPAGSLASGTITMPADPWDGQIVNIRSSQVITSVTILPNTGQFVIGQPNSFAQGGGTEAVYKASDTTWYFTPGNISGQSFVATSNLSFFVATTGSDSNPGTSLQPFATVQHAVNVAAQYDYQGSFFPTINLAAGTYALSTIITLPQLNRASQNGLIKGDHVTPGNVVLHDLNSVGVFKGIGSLALWSFDGIQFDTGFFVFQTLNGSFLRVAGPINITDGSVNVGLFTGLIKTQEGLGIVCNGQTVTILVAKFAAYTSLFVNSFCNILNSTFSLQPSTVWTTGEGLSNNCLLIFHNNTVTNAGTATGGGMVLQSSCVYESSAGTVADLGQTGGISADPTCSIVQTKTPTSAGWFFKALAGPPTTAAVPNLTYLPFKDSNAANGAGLDMFYNDSGVIFGLRSGSPFQVTAPAAGATVTSSYGLRSNILNPAGTLATLTVNLPTGQYDGAITRISSSQQITALTIATTDASLIVGAPATLAAGGAIQFLYQASNTTWYIN